MHSANHSLGAFVLAVPSRNIAALWVARNNALKASRLIQGCRKRRLIQSHETLRLRRPRYLGFWTWSLLSLKNGGCPWYWSKKVKPSVKTDNDNRICTDDLRLRLNSSSEIRLSLSLSLVWLVQAKPVISTTLETLQKCVLNPIVIFHVGTRLGPVRLWCRTTIVTYLMVLNWLIQSLLIRINSFIAIGAGMVCLKPDAMTAIEHHAQYILRKGFERPR